MEGQPTPAEDILTDKVDKPTKVTDSHTDNPRDAARSLDAKEDLGNAFTKEAAAGSTTREPGGASKKDLDVGKRFMPEGSMRSQVEAPHADKKKNA